MRRSLLVPFLILALMLPSVLAKDSIFSDNIRSGQSIDVDDDYTFIITMNSRADEIFVNGGDLFQNIPITTCENLGDVYEFCFYNVTFDEDEEVLMAEIEIFRKEPSLTITKTLNTTEVNLGQEVLVTLTISNTGDPAQQVTLLDEYPESILISELEGPGCMEHENTITWSGHLNTDAEKTCTFIIRGTEEMHRSIVAKVRYWNGLKWVTEYSTKTTIDIEPSMTVDFSFVREDFEVDGETYDFDEELPEVFVGETPRVLLRISRDVPEKIYMKSFRITFPEGLTYVGPANLRFNYINATGNRSSTIWNSDTVTKTSSTVVGWDRDLAENSTDKYLILKFLAKRSAEHNIFIDAEYEIGDDRIKGTYHDTLPIRVTDPGILITASFDDESELFSVPRRLVEEDDDVDLQSSQPYRFTVYAQNRNPFTDLKGLRFWTKTDLANFSAKNYPSLLAEKQVIPWSLVMIPAHITGDRTMPLNISVSYTNEFGEKGYNSTEWDVNVRAFSPITIEHDSSEGFVLEGHEKTIMTVTLQNERVSDIKNVFVRDDIPEEFEVLGVTNNKLKLVKDETSEVYKYEINPPIVGVKRYFNLTTTVAYFDENLNQEFNFTKTSSFTIMPREPDVDFTLTLDEPDTTYPGTLIDATVEVTNNEEEELMKDITISFPVSRDIDLVGPKTFFIPRLEPGENIEIKNIFQLRPKVNGTLKIAPAYLDYSDSYGVDYRDNITDDTIEVESGLISGPAVFVSAVVPNIGNVSTVLPLAYQVRNLGNALAKTKVIIAGKVNDLTIPPGGLKTIPMDRSYSKEGEYSLPPVDAEVEFYGRTLHTSSTEAFFTVQSILGPENITMEEEAIPEVQAAPEPVSIEELEEALLKEEGKEQQRSYVYLIILALVGAIVVVGYILYQRGKKGTGDIFFE